MKLYGNSVTLTATFAPLESPGRGVYHLTLRNASGNDRVFFSNNGTTPIGFVDGGEAKTFYQMSSAAVYVRGTAGQTLYWDGEGV